MVARPADPPLSPPVEPPKPLRKTPPFWQALFAGCTALFGLGLLVNAIITSLMLSEQKTLTRQQVVGTQAAELGYQFTLYSPDNTLSVSFDHRGNVAAREVRLVFRAVRKKIPTLEDIEAPINKTIYEPLYSKDSYLHQQHDFSLPGLTPSEFEAMKRTEQTVKVEGEFSYDNGFGDVRRYPVCLYWLIGIQNVTEDKGGANGFYPCEDFEIRMNNALKARREALVGQTGR